MSTTTACTDPARCLLCRRFKVFHSGFRLLYIACNQCDWALKTSEEVQVGILARHVLFGCRMMTPRKTYRSEEFFGIWKYEDKR